MIAVGRPVRAMVPLAAAVAAYPLLPSGLVRDLGYQTIGLLAVVAAFWGLSRQVSARWGWLMVLCAFLGLVVGHSVQTLGAHVTDVDTHPGPVDAACLASYGALTAGLLLMARRRGERRDLTAALDAAVLGAGLAVVAAVFLVAPILRDPGPSLAARLTSSAYPLADVLMLSVLVGLWTTPGAKTAAFRLLSGAVTLILLGDALHQYRTVVDSSVGSVIGSVVVEELLWLAGYVLVVGAAWSTVPEVPAESVPGQVRLIDLRRRVVVLAAGVALPGATLLVDGLTGGRPEWTLVAGGALLVSLLVAVRLAGLLSRGQDQAVALGALARSDPLTGIPNLRTWEFELARATTAARKQNAPLTVALLDLDHLQEYNESRGRSAGDRLLREAADAWSELRRPGQLLARYGGDEFALLCPGLWADDVRPMVDAMRAATPGGQSVSAGIATWDPLTEPSSVVSTASQFLTEAKRAGRNQVHVAPRPTNRTLIPRPTMMWQPIVDLHTTRPVGVEALSRFPGDDPQAVFETASGVGSGPTLEAVAITYALTNRPEGLWVAVNVSLEALGSVQVQRALAGSLHGVVLEITEHRDADVPDLAGLVQELRVRGASIAVDDWGPGIATMDRLVTLQPDIVKLDLSRVPSLESERAQAGVRLVLAWAESAGAMVCAEGVETEAQWRALCELGVDLGQGHFFGRPMPPEELLALPRDTVAPRMAAPVPPRRLRLG